MHNNIMFAKHNRGSSPSGRDAEPNLDEWMRKLQSVDQHPYDLTIIKSLKRGPVPQVKGAQKESDNAQLSLDLSHRRDESFRREYE